MIFLLFSSSSCIHNKILDIDSNCHENIKDYLGVTNELKKYTNKTKKSALIRYI